MTRKKTRPDIRRAVEERSQYRCCYCLTQRRVTGIQLVIDHIVPVAVGGDDSLNNLCSACWDCNLLKSHHTHRFDPETEQIVPLFHPNNMRWGNHFRWIEDGLLIEGLTATGRATLITLQLNRESLLIARTLWIESGWHPPDN